MVLFVALVVLVAMSFAGLAIMRSVGSDILIAANLAFKQTTTAGAERGVELARAWLMTATGKDFDRPADGYYSSWGTFDPLTGFNWNDADKVGGENEAVDAAGTRVRWVIHRLCELKDKPHNDTNQSCITQALATAKAGTSTGGVAYGQLPIKDKLAPYYRITVRSVGPKNAVSFVQVVVD